MSAEIQTKIEAAVKARVNTLPMSYAKDWEMETFTPVATQPYIEIRFLWNTTQRLFIGSTEPHRRPLILQITLCWPVTGIGSGAGKQLPATVKNIAAQIGAHFPTDLRMAYQDVTVRVEKAPDVATPFRDDAFWRLPVSIRLESFS